VDDRQCARCHDQAAIRGVRECRNPALDLTAPIGLSSTPSNGAADWMAANCPMPELRVGSGIIPARLTRGVISLSSSSHFPLRLYSNWLNPVKIAAGTRQAGDEASADWISNEYRHNRHSAGRL
jgi:hypothetical protein